MTKSNKKQSPSTASSKHQTQPASNGTTGANTANTANATGKHSPHQTHTRPNQTPALDKQTKYHSSVTNTANRSQTNTAYVKSKGNQCGQTSTTNANRHSQTQKLQSSLPNKHS
eukprot:m.90156 g.90156  ORF g.90156 m.90156 type:complete len:114 (+) comp14994_c0_seq2:89-430(+)